MIFHMRLHQGTASESAAGFAYHVCSCTKPGVHDMSVMVCILHTQRVATGNDMLPMRDEGRGGGHWAVTAAASRGGR